MANKTIKAGLNGGSPVEASAKDDGLVTPSDSTELTFRSLYIGSGTSGTIVVSRDGGTTSSPGYDVSGPQTLNVSGNRVMATGTSLTGTNVIWQDW